MSGSTRIGSARAAAAAAFGHVREAAAKMKPYASGAQAAAGRGAHKARAFAAPRVEARRPGCGRQPRAQSVGHAVLGSAAARAGKAAAPALAQAGWHLAPEPPATARRGGGYLPRPRQASPDRSGRNRHRHRGITDRRRSVPRRRPGPASARTRTARSVRPDRSLPQATAPDVSAPMGGPSGRPGPDYGTSL